MKTKIAIAAIILLTCLVPIAYMVGRSAGHSKNLENIPVQSVTVEMEKLRPADTTPVKQEKISEPPSQNKTQDVQEEEVGTEAEPPDDENEAAKPSDLEPKEEAKKETLLARPDLEIDVGDSPVQFKKFDDRLTFAKPFVCLRRSRAENPAEVFREPFNLCSLCVLTLCHLAPPNQQV